MSYKRGLDAIEELAGAVDGMSDIYKVLARLGTCGTKEYQYKYDKQYMYGSGLAAWLRCAVQDARRDMDEEYETCDSLVSDATVALPVGADGKPIRPGDIVYGKDGRAWEVEYVRFGVAPRARKYQIAAVSTKNGERKKLRAEWLTHERPDSWERLEEDATMPPSDYCYSNGFMGVDNETPYRYMARDLVRRAKALAGVQKVHTC